MTSSDADALFSLIADLADAARDETLPRFRTALAAEDKSGGGAFDPVTAADREAERAIRDRLASVRPDDGVLGEEFPETHGPSGLRWVLDPVDGTRAFVCGLPSWTTLIGLERDGAPVLGLIDQPFTDERYIGGFGRAEHRGRAGSGPVRTSGVGELRTARIACTDPRTDGYFSEDEAGAFARLAREARVARFGFDAYAFAMLAAGHLDIVVDATLKPWDAAGPIALIEAAGGLATGWDGGPFSAERGGRIVASASPRLHDEALKRLSGV